MAFYAGPDGMVKCVEYSVTNPRLERVVWLSASDALDLYRRVQLRGFESQEFCALAQEL